MGAAGSLPIAESEKNLNNKKDDINWSMGSILKSLKSPIAQRRRKESIQRTASDPLRISTKQRYNNNIYSASLADKNYPNKSMKQLNKEEYLIKFPKYQLSNISSINSNASEDFYLTFPNTTSVQTTYNQCNDVNKVNNSHQTPREPVTPASCHGNSSKTASNSSSSSKVNKSKLRSIKSCPIKPIDLQNSSSKDENRDSSPHNRFSMIQEERISAGITTGYPDVLPQPPVDKRKLKISNSIDRFAFTPKTTYRRETRPIDNLSARTNNYSETFAKNTVESDYNLKAKGCDAQQKASGEISAQSKHNTHSFNKSANNQTSDFHENTANYQAFSLSRLQAGAARDPSNLQYSSGSIKSNESSLEAENLTLKESFNSAKKCWLREKMAVLAYQKYMQDSYLETKRCNEELQRRYAELLKENQQLKRERDFKVIY